MTSPRFHTMLSYRRPHPEEHRLAMRLEGWATTTVYPTLRDVPAGLLRVRLGLYQHSMKGGTSSRHGTSRYSFGRARTGSSSDQSPCSTSKPLGNGGRTSMSSERMTRSSR